MSLFKRETDGSTLKFHFLKLSDIEAKEITKLIEENGGEVGEDPEMPGIKFIKRSMYNHNEYHSWSLYDSDFIRTCIREGKLVELETFRLGPKTRRERGFPHTFQNGKSHDQNNNDGESGESVVTNDVARDVGFPVGKNGDENNENQSSQYETATDVATTIKVEIGSTMDHEQTTQSFLSPGRADSASFSATKTSPRLVASTEPSKISDSLIKENDESLSSEKKRKLSYKLVFDDCTNRLDLEKTRKSLQSELDCSEENPMVTNDDCIPTIPKSLGTDDNSATNNALKHDCPTTVPRLRKNMLVNPYYSGYAGQTSSNTFKRRKITTSKANSENHNDETLKNVYSQIRVTDDLWDVPGPSNVAQLDKNDKFSVESTNAVERAIGTKNPSPKSNKIDGPNNGAVTTGNRNQLDANNDVIFLSDSDDEISVFESENEKTVKSENPPAISAEALKKKKAANYAKNWRRQMNGDRPKNILTTNMHFSREEQTTMVKFLISRGNILHVRPKGLKVWGELLQAGKLSHRTCQSLQNNFQKKILPQIETFFYLMTAEQQQQFKRLQNPCA